MCFNMAPAKGFEPLTPCFVGKCSIQLSYAGMLNLRAYAAFIVDLFRTYRPPSLTSSTMDITWDPSSVAPITDLRGSPRVGVEPICLLLLWSFEET